MFRISASRIAVILLLCLLMLVLSAGSILGQEPVEPMVSAGYFHNLALKEDGTVWAWGSNGSGQLGDGTTESRVTPVQVRGPGGVGFLEDVVAISAGWQYNLALKDDGTVWAWGFNGSGQLGDGTEENSNTPVQVIYGKNVPLTGIVSISAGSSHSLAVKEDGSVWAWGSNVRGELGDGTEVKRTRAVRVKGFEGEGFLEDIVEVSAGSRYFSIALDGSGNVWSWGCNSFGKLGDSTTERRHTPVRVLYYWFSEWGNFLIPLTDVTAISAGNNHSLALKENGNVVSWGRNNYGQLGSNSYNDRHYAHYVRNKTDDARLDNISAISAGEHYNLALKGDSGYVKAWGRNQFGGHGDGTIGTDRLIPVEVQSLDYWDYHIIVPLFNVNAIDAGYYTSLGIRDDYSSFWAWGSYTLGGNEPTFPYYPVRVDFPDECIVTPPKIPDGPTSGKVNEKLTYDTGGSACSEGHAIEYRFGRREAAGWLEKPKKFVFGDWSDKDPHGITYTFDKAGTYEIIAQARCELYDVISSSKILEVEIYEDCFVPQPDRPSGVTFGYTDTTYTFNTSSVSCKTCGGDIRYTWWFRSYDDDTFWENRFTMSPSVDFTFSEGGSYYLRVRATCTNTNTVSSLSPNLDIDILNISNLFGVALYDQQGGTFYVKDDTTPGPADRTFRYGPRGNDWLPVAGDWDGNGIHGVALYDQSGGTFYVKDDTEPGAADRTFRYGPRGNDWLPVAGDWDGNGIYGVALYDQSSGTFYVKDNTTPGPADRTFRYGPRGNDWLPVAGDWDGNGIYGIALYDQSSGTFYVKDDTTPGPADRTFRYGPRGNDWLPVAGDWDGNGIYGVALYDQTGGTFYVKDDTEPGPADRTFRYGPRGNDWLPVAGRWTE